jgi:PAS domain S-box-containing protein
VETSQDAIYGWAPEQGTITSWNGGAERLYKYTAEEIIGRPFSVLCPPDRLAEAEAVLDQVRQGKPTPPFETVRRRKDGRDVEVLLSITPVKGPDGRALWATTIAHDFTEIKRMESQLRQAQKMEAVGRLAGGVAHDFNNLLTVINGYSQVLLGALRGQEKAKEMVEQIHHAGERAAALTQQLLAYSRKQVQQLKVLSLNDLLAKMQKLLRPMIREDVELVVVPGPGLGRIKADPAQLEQVVMNLAVNARDAMPTGGKLTIETRNVMVEESEELEAAPGPHVVLSVTDTGHGMDEETQAHLFEPFFTTKPVGEGTGLGLATVYGIVKQSGGHIKVASAPGQGTTFNVYLPRLEEPTAGERAGPALSQMPRGTETVLLVEDEASVRSLTHYLLSQCGYKVLAASNGVEALEAAAKFAGRIDLLVTDVVMPRMGGPQLAEALRLTVPELRALYLSGYTQDSMLCQGPHESRTGFLGKPFTASDLAAKVRELLDR